MPEMNLREYYAGQALAGFCANPSVFSHHHAEGWKLVNADESQLAAYAFLLADKMMEHSDTCSKKSSKDMFMEDLKDPEFYSQVCNRLGINAGGR